MGEPTTKKKRLDDFKRSDDPPTCIGYWIRLGELYVFAMRVGFTVSGFFFIPGRRIEPIRRHQNGVSGRGCSARFESMAENQLEEEEEQSVHPTPINIGYNWRVSKGGETHQDRNKENPNWRSKTHTAKKYMGPVSKWA